MKLIVGLGNSGSEYQNTRHNFGFAVVDFIADELGVKFGKTRFKAEGVLVEKEHQKLFLLKPQTYMNLSGESVARALVFYKRTPHDLVVIHDDVDLPLGRIKWSEGGSSGGHKGVESVIESINYRDFIRLRLGIGKPTPPHQTVDHVLELFTKEEVPLAIETVKKACESVLFFLKEGLAATMNRYNGSK